MNPSDELRRLAVDVARECGKLLLDALPTGQASKSSPTDLVTDADVEAERYIVDRIRTERPRDSILSEEGSIHEGTSGVRWVVDPLDGTINFIYGIPQWCVSIGIEGSIRAGVIHDPNRGETFTDADRLRPSSKTDLADALIGTGFSYSSQMRARQAEVLRRILPRVRDVRRLGSCALDLAWVASGRFDGFFEDDTHHWDVSAGIALIEASGGYVRTHGALTIAAGTRDLLEKLEDLVLQDREPEV